MSGLRCVTGVMIVFQVSPAVVLEVHVLEAALRLEIVVQLRARTAGACHSA